MSSTLFKSDFLNHRFDKRDVCKVLLCDIVNVNDVKIVNKGEAVGVSFGGQFLNFANGDILELISDEAELRYCLEGVYAILLNRLYAKEGKISPMQVFEDLDGKTDCDFLDDDISEKDNFSVKKRVRERFIRNER